MTSSCSWVGTVTIPMEGVQGNKFSPWPLR